MENAGTGEAMTTASDSKELQVIQVLRNAIQNPARPFPGRQPGLRAQSEVLLQQPSHLAGPGARSVPGLGRGPFQVVKSAQCQPGPGPPQRGPGLAAPRCGQARAAGAGRGQQAAGPGAAA